MSIFTAIEIHFVRLAATKKTQEDGDKKTFKKTIKMTVVQDWVFPHPLCQVVLILCDPLNFG